MLEVSDNITECKSYKLLHSLGIDKPCEYCCQHIRHIHDLQSWDAIVECLGDDGKMRRQRFPNGTISSIELFAIDRLAEIMVRASKKRRGDDYLHPNAEEIHRLRIELEVPRVNSFTGHRLPSLWQSIPHPRREFANISN